MFGGYNSVQKATSKNPNSVSKPALFALAFVSVLGRKVVAITPFTRFRGRNKNRSIYKPKQVFRGCHNKFFLALLLVLLICRPVLAGFEQADSYAGYLSRLETTVTERDILKNGFTPIKDKGSREEFQNFGLVSVIPVLDERYGRLILFFADDSGRVVYKTDRFESNNWNRGEMRQPNIGLDAIDFRDTNNDGLKDIVIICSCLGESGKRFKVGDVLFQSEKGFYRDWRLSDKINRFSMNQNADVITAFVRDGQSAEFLYTANTLDELSENGFRIIKDQCFTVSFEKFGQIDVTSGIYNIAGYNILMIYLVNSDGRIVWNFQFMDDGYGFETLEGIAFRDIDGDGLRDVVVMARFGASDENVSVFSEFRALKYDYFIFYQRAGYFVEDNEFKPTYECSQWDILDTVTRRARAFWGWEAE